MNHQQWRTYTGAIQNVPRVKLFKNDKTAFDFLTFEKAKRLPTAAKLEWRTLILLASKMGQRNGELSGFKLGDVYLHRGKRKEG